MSSKNELSYLKDFLTYREPATFDERKFFSGASWATDLVKGAEYGPEDTSRAISQTVQLAPLAASAEKAKGPKAKASAGATSVKTTPATPSIPGVK